MSADDRPPVLHYARPMRRVRRRSSPAPPLSAAAILLPAALLLLWVGASGIVDALRHDPHYWLRALTLGEGVGMTCLGLSAVYFGVRSCVRQPDPTPRRLSL